MLEEVERRLKTRENQNEIKRFNYNEPEGVKKNETIRKMEVSIPIFLFGYKIKPVQDEKEKVRKDVAIEICLELIAGKSSPLYQSLYDEGLVMAEFGLDYDFENEYAHITIDGQSKDPHKVIKRIKEKIQECKENGLSIQDFNRIKKMLHGEYIKEFNGVDKIARMFASDFFKGINSFEYVDAYENIDLEYTQRILNKEFDEDKSVLSIIEPK